jgi:hypothetical protein
MNTTNSNVRHYLISGKGVKNGKDVYFDSSFACTVFPSRDEIKKTLTVTENNVTDFCIINTYPFKSQADFETWNETDPLKPSPETDTMRYFLITYYGTISGLNAFGDYAFGATGLPPKLALIEYFQSECSLRDFSVISILEFSELDFNNWNSKK